MSTLLKPIEMIEVVAAGLGELGNEVIFIGGAASVLYIEKDHGEILRPTDDVDCIVKIGSKSDYYQLENSLRSLGFENDMSSDIICRWRIDTVLVDIMPVDPDIIGFSNSWHEEGFNSRIKTELPSSTEIYILPLEFYLASKFEALDSRGGEDWRFAHDLEDILLVLDGIKDPVSVLKKGNKKANNFIKSMISKFINRPDYEDVFNSHIGYHGVERMKGLKNKLSSISIL